MLSLSQLPLGLNVHVGRLVFNQHITRSAHAGKYSLLMSQIYLNVLQQVALIRASSRVFIIKAGCKPEGSQ